MSRKYLFYISQNYSFEILRPLQQVIQQRGDQCAWLAEGSQVNRDYFHTNERQLASIKAAIDYSPHAVFVPGNVVPDFIPGLKVQVFHGLEWKKKSHFRIRGFFDLYCTHGPITTRRFNQLAAQHQYFSVAETGWPKLDPLFNTPAYQLESKLPVILFAPTFSPNLTGALDCFNEIRQQVNKGQYYWLVKFHPKMCPDVIARYREIKAPNFEIVETDCCLPLLQRANILLSDTSSIIAEFMLLQKPVVTYNNAEPGDELINFTRPEQLHRSLEKALIPSTELIASIAAANKAVHPHKDGVSASRVLACVDNILDNPPELKKKKPLNLLRRLKLRKRLNYWKF